MGRLELQAFAVAAPRSLEWPDLPKVTAQQIELEALFFAPPRKIRQNYRGKDLRINGPIWGTTVEQGIVAKVSFGGVVYFALFPPALPRRLLTLNGYSGDIDSWSSETQALVLDYLLGDLLTPLQDHLGGEIQIEGVSDAPISIAKKMLGFRVSVSGEPHFLFHVAAKSAKLRDLAALCGSGSARPRAAARIDVPFTARVCLPDATVPHSDLAALCAGDGLVIDAEWSRRGNLYLDIGAHLSAKISHRDGRLTVSSPLAPHSSMDQQRGTEMNQNARITPPSPAEDTDKLPVVVTIELGRTTLTLAQIKELTVGGVVPFADELTTRVLVYANDAVIGQGDLVRFDDKIAVRLIELD